MTIIFSDKIWACYHFLQNTVCLVLFQSDQRHDGDNHRRAGAVPGHRPREGEAGGGDGKGEGSKKVAQVDAGRRGGFA